MHHGRLIYRGQDAVRLAASATLEAVAAVLWDDAGAVRFRMPDTVTGDPFQGYEKTERVHDLSTVALEVPVIPPTFYCVGLNYAEHVRAAAAKLGIEANLPKQPDVGYRAVNALIAHDEPVVIPADASKVQYEGELVVVIGKRAKNLSQALQALQNALAAIDRYVEPHALILEHAEPPDPDNAHAQGAEHEP